MDVKQFNRMHDLIFRAIDALYRKSTEEMRQALEDAHAESICVCDSEGKKCK